MRSVAFLICLSTLILGVEFHLKGGIPFGYTPILDGDMERSWRNSLEFRAGKEIESFRLMRDEHSVFLLIELTNDSSYYIGKSRYLDVFSGKSCWTDGTLLRIPFKFWKGRAYVFTVKNGVQRISGFSGVGFGKYIELSIPAPSLRVWNLCIRFLDSRTLDILESYEMVVYSGENDEAGGS